MNYSFQDGLSEKVSLNVVSCSLKAQAIVQTFFADTLSDLTFVVVGNHRELCEITETYRPKYGVTTNKNGVVYLYDPSTWTVEETGHTPKDLTESLIHQLVHVFVFRHRLQLPNWFEEGLAVYVGAHLSKHHRFSELKMLHKKYGPQQLYKNTLSIKDHQVPAYSYLLASAYVEYIEKELGHARFTTFLLEADDEKHFTQNLFSVTHNTLEGSWSRFEQKLEKALQK